MTKHLVAQSYHYGMILPAVRIQRGNDEFPGKGRATQGSHGSNTKLAKEWSMIPSF